MVYYGLVWSNLPLALGFHPRPLKDLPRRVQVPRELLKPSTLEEHMAFALLGNFLERFEERSDERSEECEGDSPEVNGVTDSQWI